MGSQHDLRMFRILLSFVLISFGVASTYTITNILPTSISVFGGNTITITASDYPAFSTVEDIVCMWEETFLVTGEFTSSSTIVCPVPSVFRFTPFTPTSTATLTSLKVSFDTDAAATDIVSLTLLGFRVVSDELAPFAIYPRYSFESFTDAVVSITGVGFPTSLPADQTFCRFTTIGVKGGLGSNTLVSGTVVNSTSMSCIAPTLSEIDGNATAPAEAVIQLSFDGAQTFSFAQAGFFYFADFQVTSISPNTAFANGGKIITLYGSNFYDSTFLSCRFVSIGESPSREYDASPIQFVSASEIQCGLPVFSPDIDPGNFEIFLTIDGNNFVDSGWNISISNAPGAGTLIPSAGYYSGGTLVTVTGTGLENTTDTMCQFGSAGTLLVNYIDTTMVQCLSPACTSAIPSFSGNPSSCSGAVHVAVVKGTLLSLAALANSPLVFQYLNLQRIHHFEPWPGSSWDAVFVTTFYGIGLNVGNNTMYCKWGALDPVIASSSGAVTDSTNPEIDSFAVCEAPILPIEYRPDWTTTGLDFFVSYMEISMNNLDYTPDRRQWYFYEPATVSTLFPTSIWQQSVSAGGVYVSGTFFRKIAPEFLSCLWYYENNVFELVPAVFADRQTIHCIPTQPVDSAATTVRVEVCMTPLVYSDSEQAMDATQQPEIISVNAVSGPYLGQTMLIVSGENFSGFTPQPVYVVIGDVPVLGVVGIATGGLLLLAQQTVTILMPPVPHFTSTPAQMNISIAFNAQQRLEFEPFTYQAVSAGEYFSNGTAVVCPIGFFCGGGYPSNDTVSLTNMLLPTPCPAGTFQPAAGKSGCFPCASPGLCPGPALASPELCAPGRVCWPIDGLTALTMGYGADAPYCPMGQLCLLPPGDAIVEEIPALIDPFARRLGSNLLQSCPTGQFCPPGSSMALICSQPGVWCPGGASSAYTFDQVPAQGWYVDNDDGSLLECPFGYSCVTGIRTACAAGSFQNATGAITCEACTAGTICPVAVRQFPKMCPRGRVCSLPGRYSATYLCPAGSYCLFATLTLSTTSVVRAVNQPQICEAGTYCLSGTNAALPDLTNPSAPRQCAVGFFCYTNETGYQGAGSCPLGNYCVLGSQIPIPAPPGYYVDYLGAYAPTRCPHGYYQDEPGQSYCKLCTEGSECPTDGMSAPIVCAPAYYRSNTDPFYTQVEDNIDCHPCPQGTWNWAGNLTASTQCITCPERYVCAREGMTVFATITQTDCSVNSDGVQICYALSQAYDCPEGYACDVGTTSFTQFDFPCEPGYFCKVLTALQEMRDLLCPAGFYCKQATGASKASSLPCPAGYFCPQGTAEVDQGSTRTLYNVQSTYVDPTTGVLTTDVNTTNAITGASCKVCDPALFVPPTLVNTSTCTPCGILQSDGIQLFQFSSGTSPPTDYAPISAWSALTCPDGTTSVRGSGLPADCIQEGYVLAVVNIYNSSEVVDNLSSGTQTPLWNQDREFAWVNISSPQYALKKTLPFGQPVSSTNDYIVDFLAYDPRDGGDVAEQYQFVSIAMDAMDLMTLVLDFSKVPMDTVMATNANPGGHYNLVISSDALASGSTQYLLPVTISQGDGDIHELFELKLLSLMDGVNLNVSVALVHGSHYPDMHYFNNAASITLSYPNKTDAGQRRNFYAVTSGALLNNGGYELPYNLIPTYANEPGDISLVVDLANQVNYTIDTSLKTGMIPGTTFWQVAPSATVVTPWFPFFSNCDYFDKHITIWDLFENGNTLPASAGACQFYESAEVRIVPPFIFDFSTQTFQFQPVADFCELALHCRFEDNMDFGAADPIPWMSIPGSVTLFYITQSPLLWSEVSSLELDSWVGTDALIPVYYDASSRTGNFPRLVNLKIEYTQVTSTTKQIVQAQMTLDNFDNDNTRSDYVLQVSWEPMNWAQMMDTFQLPMYVYLLVYGMCGIAAVGAALLAWAVLHLVMKSTRMPPFRIYDCYNFVMGHGIQGVLVGAVGPAVVAGIIKLVMLASTDPLANVACAWAKGTSSTAAVLIGGTSNTVVCHAVRTGTCLITSGVFMLWSASQYFSPRLPEDHKEYLVSGSAKVLQDDGVYYPAKTKFAKPIITSVLQWKRIHLFYVAVLVSMPLMVMFSISYSSMFGSFTNSYTVGYMVTMLAADLLFIKVAREKLMFSALSAVTDVVYFIATMAAQDLTAFIGSYLLQMFFTVAQRLVAERIINYTYERIVPSISRWIRSRQIVWISVMTVGRISKFLRPREPVKQVVGGPTVGGNVATVAVVENTGLEYSTVRHDKLDSAVPIVDKEGLYSIDENADQTMGVAGRTLSLLFSPFAILLLVLFPTETMFPANYGLKYAAIPYYLLFSVLIIPFQIGLDLIINHGFDSSIGLRIYDYMYLCRWRWQNRLTRWLLDDSRLDASIGESTRAIHHLCFSPQFYFIITYAIAGGLFMTYGITCWIVQGVPAIVDPAFLYYVVLMYLATRVSDAIARWLVFYVMWKPADRAPERAFIQSIALGLKQKELEEHQVAFRNFFFNRHREWIIDNLDKVYTPRGMEKYRAQLSEIYQRVLTTRIPYLYSAPPQSIVPIAIEKPRDDAVTDLAKIEYPTDDMYEVRLSDDDDEGAVTVADDLTKSAGVGSALVQGWFLVAKQRLARQQGRSLLIETSPQLVEAFPDWLVVNITEGSRNILKRWLQNARDRIAGSRGNIW